MSDVGTALQTLLGVSQDGADLSPLQMVLRAVAVYVLAVAIVRLAKKRFMGRATAFDLILAIVLGSIFARVITGDAPFVAGMAAALALVAVHGLFSVISLRWRGFGALIKGQPSGLVRDGEIDGEAMRKVHMTEDDLWEDLRAEGISRLDEVASARLERSGQVSVIRRK